ncbi:MAG: acyl-CoA thioesterase [Pseudomonadota bacterium]
MAFETRRHVDWGDCDAAGIVFYPTYFRWMDSVFHEMTRALGFDQRTVVDHDVTATPLVDAGARFVSPVSHGDVLSVTVRVGRMGTTGFTVTYSFRVSDRSVAEGHESRVCVLRNPSGAIAKTPIPDAIRTLLRSHHE